MTKVTIEEFISPKVTIKKSEVEGRGMFAKELIREEEVVARLGGLYTDDREEAKTAKEEGKLIMQWDTNLFSIEDRGESESYFINHSCDSNLRMLDAYTLTARKDIQAGEELTADYTLWEGDENHIAPWECRCSSSTCRKQITGKDWRIKELQERYKNHFSPLINKRIQEQEK